MTRGNGQRVIATIEARMNSSRLPGKTLFPLLGQPVLARVVERIGRATRVDQVVVATSLSVGDDPIAKWCRKAEIPFFRGSEEDVLGRVTIAAITHRADIVVQLGADCPFYDPSLIDQLVDIFCGGTYDYVANDMELTYPEGIDAHVFSMLTLKEIESRAVRSRDREDVPRYIWDHPERYRIFNMKAPPDFHAPDVRLTLDYPEDWRLTKHLYETLYPSKPDFMTRDILDHLKEHPEWKSVNVRCRQLSAPYLRETSS